MIPIGTSFELRQQAFSTNIVLEPEGVPAHVIFLVGLAGGPLRARPATLLARSWVTGALGGRLDVTGVVGRTLLGLDPLNGYADPLAVGPLAWGGMGPGAKGPLGIGDLVGSPVLLDLSRGLTPGPPTPGRLGH
jgi:hypothetical protein